MTEVPEYLLERSRARRAALGLGGGSAPAASGPAGAPAGGGGAPAGGGGAPAGGGGGGGDGGAAAATGAPAPAAAPAAAPAPAATEALPTYVDAGPRSGIPVWMMPVLVVLPLWAVVYLGAFVEHSAAGGVRSGQEIFTSICSTCHGPQGQGGVGPKLAGGEAAKTFPDMAAQVEFVSKGSSAIKGQPYGDPAREGGQHVANTGGMPAWAGQLSPAEIQAVVQFEREGL
jgi:mono/diheme cytochrome c family protein